MAFAASSGMFVWPVLMGPDPAAAPSFTGLLIDSATEYVAQHIGITSTGTLSKIGFRSSTVTAAGTVDLRIETPGTRGASGTLYQTAATVSIPVTASSTWYTATLDSGTVVHVGSTIVVKLQMTSSSGATGNLQISQSTIPQPFKASFPYSTRFQGTTSSVDTELIPIALEYLDGSFPPMPGVYPISAISQNTYNSGTVAFDEFGVAFSLPFPVQCHGVLVNANFGAGGTANLVFYDQDTTTVLSSIFINPQDNSSGNPRTQFRLLPAPLQLVANGTYRLTQVPLTTTNIVAHAYIGSSLAVMSQFDHGGTRFIGTQRVNSGAWTDDARQYPTLGLLLNGFDDGASGSTTVVTGGAWGF